MAADITQLSRKNKTQYTAVCMSAACHWRSHTSTTHT